jgi:hypothetical protein
MIGNPFLEHQQFAFFGADLRLGGFLQFRNLVLKCLDFGLQRFKLCARLPYWR